MDKVTLLIVEDSPQQRRLIAEEMIDKFADQQADLSCTPMDKKMEFRNLTLHWCDTLSSAENLLRTHTFDGAMIDIGFPEDDTQAPERLHGNRCGLQLVQKIRKNTFPSNTDMIIAIGSAENVIGKMTDFFDNTDYKRDITRGFEKGRPAVGTENMNVFNSELSRHDEGRRKIYNRDTVAKQPVQWMYQQIQTRKHPEQEKPPRKPQKSTWSIW